MFHESALVSLEPAMNGEPLRRTFTVSNPQGLHMRPITKFVELANTFKSDVFVAKQGDAKAGLALLAKLGERTKNVHRQMGWAHGALLTTYPGDTTMATLEQVKAFAKGGSARIQR